MSIPVQPITALHDKKIVKVACGSGQNIAVCEEVEGDVSKNKVYSWGKVNQARSYFYLL